MQGFKEQAHSQVSASTSHLTAASRHVCGMHVDAGSRSCKSSWWQDARQLVHRLLQTFSACPSLLNASCRFSSGRCTKRALLRRFRPQKPVESQLGACLFCRVAACHWQDLCSLKCAKYAPSTIPAWFAGRPEWSTRCRLLQLLERTTSIILPTLTPRRVVSTR